MSNNLDFSSAYRTNYSATEVQNAESEDKDTEEDNV